MITLEGYDGSWHPNNRAAPEANRLLVDVHGFRPLPRQRDLPDGSRLILLSRQVK